MSAKKGANHMDAWVYILVTGGLIIVSFPIFRWVSRRYRGDDELQEDHDANESRALPSGTDYGTMPSPRAPSISVPTGDSDRFLSSRFGSWFPFSRASETNPEMSSSSVVSAHGGLPISTITSEHQPEEKSLVTSSSAVTAHHVGGRELVPISEDRRFVPAKLDVHREVISEQLSLLKPYFEGFIKLLPDRSADILLGERPDLVYQGLYKQFISIVELGKEGDASDKEYCQRSLGFFNDFVYGLFAAFSDWLSEKQFSSTGLIKGFSRYENIKPDFDARAENMIYTRKHIESLMACLNEIYSEYIEYSVEFLRQLKIVSSIITLCLKWFQALNGLSPEEKEEDLISQLTEGKDIRPEPIDLTVGFGVTDEVAILSKLWWRLAAHYECKKESLPTTYVNKWFESSVQFPGSDLFGSFNSAYSLLEALVTRRKKRLKSHVLISNLYNLTLSRTCEPVVREKFNGRTLRELFILEYLVHGGDRWEDLEEKKLKDLISLRDAKLAKEKSMDSGSSSEKKQVASAFYSSASSTHAPTGEQDEKLGGGSQFQGHF